MRSYRGHKVGEEQHGSEEQHKGEAHLASRHREDVSEADSEGRLHDEMQGTHVAG